MAGYAAGNIVDFIRGFGQRKEAAQVKEAQKNYLNDPAAAIQEVNQINPNVALALRDDNQNQMNIQADTLKKSQAQYLGAVKNMAGMLRNVRDQGGDLGAAFDGLTPTMTRGFGMAPEEVLEWKAKITGNPALIDALEQDADEKAQLLTPGSKLYKNGKIVADNPAQPKVVQAKRGDGGVDIMVFDPDTGLFVNQGTGGASAPGAGVGGSSGVQGGKYNGPLTVNPEARGVRNGNPGNIKDGKFAQSQPGYLGSDGTFAKFAPGFGEKAQENLLINNYFGKGLNTVEAIVDKYLGAGDGENSQASRANYKAYVTGRLGLQPGDPVPTQSVRQLGQAMREFENGSGPQGAANAGPVYSTPGKPTKPGYRIATPAEKQAAGVDAATPYQISPEGKIEKIGERAAGAAGKATLGKATPQQVTTYRGQLNSMVQQVDRILKSPDFNTAVGPIQGRIAGYLSKGAADVQNDIQSLRDRIVVRTLEQMKAMSKTGASGFGNFTEKEGTRLENQLGNLSTTGGEDGLRRSLEEVKQWAADQMAALPNADRVPKAAKAFLLANPQTAGQFDAMYGAGSSNLILGK